VRIKSYTNLISGSTIDGMDEKLVKEIEEQIADLKARFPAHSVPPHMWQQLEELEDKLEQAKGKPDSE
jgi:hypothetical protein